MNEESNESSSSMFDRSNEWMNQSNEWMNESNKTNQSNQRVTHGFLINDTCVQKSYVTRIKNRRCDCCVQYMYSTCTCTMKRLIAIITTLRSPKVENIFINDKYVMSCHVTLHYITLQRAITKPFGHRLICHINSINRRLLRWRTTCTVRGSQMKSCRAITLRTQSVAEGCSMWPFANGFRPKRGKVVE